MVSGEQADWESGQQDGFFMYLEGEEEKGEGRVDLDRGWTKRERQGGREGDAIRQCT